MSGKDHWLSLQAALKAAAAGEGRIVLVSGEAGIGKTSLVEQFTHEHQKSIRILWGACDALFTPRPLGPLLDMAMQLEGDLPDLLRSGHDRAAIFSAFLAELHGRPTIAVFEDIHWADEATLDLIKFIARRVQRTPHPDHRTYRDDELGAGHPLRLVLGDLPRAATDRLQLLPLSKASVQILASAADQAARAKELFDTTSGNPFFVTEILAVSGQGMPANVRDAVLARAARLSPSARAVLEAAAVIGSRIGAVAFVEYRWRGVRECRRVYRRQECFNRKVMIMLFVMNWPGRPFSKPFLRERRLALHRMTLTAAERIA